MTVPVPLLINHLLIAAQLHHGQAACLQAWLENDGVALTFVNDSLQAMNAVSSRHYALALVAANLPDTGGLALCRQLTHHLETPVPVTLLLAADNPAESLAGLEAGALLCLSASAQAREIYLHVRNFLLARPDAPVVAAPPASFSRLGHGQIVLDTLPGAVIITDTRQQVVNASAALPSLTGLDPQDALQLSIRDVFSHLHFNISIDSMLQKLAADGMWQGELLNPHRDNLVIAYWLHAATIKGKDEVKPAHYLFYLVDISHLKRREQRLRSMAETDALTGLANRNQFLSRLNEAIAWAKAGVDDPAILFLDLDNFKSVNDHLGHDKGDQLLCEIAGILQKSVRNNDLVARFGGDEFAILLLSATRSSLQETAQRIVDRLVFVFTGKDNTCIEVTCSIGIAVHPRDGRTAASLLKQADQAMYAVKNLGKQGYCFASDDPE